jgi:hypothetical protein
MNPGAQALVAGGTLTALAALAHLGCIVIGGRAYRFLGAGERMARAAEAGRLRPTLVTLAIAAVLFACAVYAFSGAGLIGRLPFTRTVLAAACAVFLARAIGFPLLKGRFPENSAAFWWWSSGICLVLGLLYAAGSLHVWSAG